MSGHRRRGRRRRRPEPGQLDPQANKTPLSVKNVLGSSFPFLGLGKRIKEFKVLRAWTDIVGENIALRARPSSIKRSILYVEVTSAAWMNELQFHVQTIIEKTNALLGEGYIKKVIFKASDKKEFPPTATSKKKPRPLRELTESEEDFIEKTTAVVEDETIRETIKRAMEKSKTMGGDE